MATIVHFDIGAENPDRARNFYQSLFGWKFDTLPGPTNYTLIQTNDLNDAKGIGGGMTSRGKDDPTGIVNFIGVKSIEDSLVAVERLGGKIVKPKQAVPGWGYLAVCMDTENNRFGLFQETNEE